MQSGVYIVLSLIIIPWERINLKNFTKRIICNGYILWNQNQINLNIFFKHMTSYDTTSI